MSDTLEKNIPLITELSGATVGGVVHGTFGPAPTYSPPLGGLTISAVGGGGSGGLFTSNGINGSYSINQPGINVSPGITKITSPLEVNGRDILKELDEMRDALLLLKRDVNMEAKYPKLKELKDAYERALEKYKTFDAIKDSK